MVGISGWINWCKGWRQRRFSTLQKNQERDTLRLIPHTSKHGGGVVARILTLQGSWKWDGVGEIIFSPSSSMFFRLWSRCYSIFFTSLWNEGTALVGWDFCHAYTRIVALGACTEFGHWNARLIRGVEQIVLREDLK